MSADARHTFVAAYERRMLTLVSHVGAGRRVSFRVALMKQARMLAAAIVDPRRRYRSLRWK